VNPMVMAVAVNSGLSTGGLAPTSLFGIVTTSTARQAGIDLNPLTLLAAAIVVNLALIAAATWLFVGSRLATVPFESDIEPAPSFANATERKPEAASARFTSDQFVTLICIIALILSVITSFALGLERTSA
jgi:hypothetical protein